MRFRFSSFMVVVILASVLFPLLFVSGMWIESKQADVARRENQPAMRAFRQAEFRADVVQATEGHDLELNQHRVNLLAEEISQRFYASLSAAEFDSTVAAALWRYDGRLGKVVSHDLHLFSGGMLRNWETLVASLYRLARVAQENDCPLVAQAARHQLHQVPALGRAWAMSLWPWSVKDHTDIAEGNALEIFYALPPGYRGSFFNYYMEFNQVPFYLQYPDSFYAIVDTMALDLARGNWPTGAWHYAASWLHYLEPGRARWLLDSMVAHAGSEQFGSILARGRGEFKAATDSSDAARADFWQSWIAESRESYWQRCSAQCRRERNIRLAVENAVNPALDEQLRARFLRLASELS